MGKPMSELTPEQRERRRATRRRWDAKNKEWLRQYGVNWRKENPNYSHEWRAKNPEKNKASQKRSNDRKQQRLRDDPAYREKILADNRARNFCVHGGLTDRSRIPAALVNEVRLKCFEMGLEPGIKCHMLQAIIAVQTKYSNMGRAGNTEYNWLHPDDMDYRARSWANNWNRSPKIAQRFYKQHPEALDYNCQASNRDT